MLLQTNCTGCIYRKGQGGCFLSKPLLYPLETQQFTEGFCRYKRSQKWYNKNCEGKELSETVLKVGEEEYAITAIINCFSNSLDALKKTLVYLNRQDRIKQIVVATFNLNGKETQDFIDLLNSQDVAWSLEVLKETDPHAEVNLVDHFVGAIKYNWFITMMAGDVIEDSAIKAFESIMDDNNKNPVCFYFKETDKYRIIGNKFAFMEMKGNYDMHWIDKLKTFDFWENVCHQIS